jgi:hypothetical protein
MTRRAIDADRWQSAEMLHLCPTKTNRPAEIRIGNQAEMSEIGSRKQIRIRFDEGTQHRLGYHFSAHGAVQKKVEIILRPRRNLRHPRRRRFFFCRAIQRDHQTAK